MTILKNLEKTAGTEKVTILVGPDEVPFRVHKNVICEASDYFDAAFKSGFKEADEGIIRMSEENPLVFRKLLAWLYNSKLPNGFGTSCQRLLYDIYIMAEKLCMEELANMTIDRIRINQHDILTHGGGPERHFKHVKHIYDNTGENSPLRTLLVQMMSLDLKYNGPRIRDGKSTLSGEVLEALWEVSKDHKEFFQSFFTEYTRKSQRDDYQFRPATVKIEFCYFHKHRRGGVCYLPTFEEYLHSSPFSTSRSSRQ
ncbi:hypothetical protein VTL71DRAFT_12054 [Oculimacula yallundae]|uniref:BTB domain-containing protein n=1 Tax=Oculimacula yallundae TaxID=86028 RepID=A0ABR4CTG4_9HELO